MTSEFTDILINEIITVQNDKKSQIKSSDYLDSGKLPIIDQSSNFICGYTNDLTKRYSKEIPVIVFGDHTLHLKYIDFEFATGADGTQILRPLNRDDYCKYLFYIILRETQMMESQGYKRHLKILKERFVPYSNKYAEQKKIASILTSVDEVIENTQKQIDNLQNLKKATMNELLTKGIGHTEFKDSELGRIPKGWKVKDIASSNIQVLDGDRGSEYPKEYDFEQSGYCLFLSAKNVTRSGFKFDETVFISRDKDRKLQKGRLKRNDIVITTRGTVGNIAFFDESVVFDVIRINSGMAIIRNDDECLQTNFLYLILSSEFVTLQLENLTFGSAQPQLTIGTLNELKILIPTVDEQREISNVVSSVNQLITVTTKKLLQTQSLKKSLMQDLLTGKVRVKVN